MTDIVQRLREYSAFSDCDQQEINTLRAAADEIERLRADAARGRWMLTNCEWRRHSDNDVRYSLLAIRLPYDADQSCLAMRQNAIDAAMKGKT